MIPFHSVSQINRGNTKTENEYSTVDDVVRRCMSVEIRKPSKRKSNKLTRAHTIDAPENVERSQTVSPVLVVNDDFDEGEPEI